MGKKQILPELDIMDGDDELINAVMSQTHNSRVYSKKVLDLTLSELINLVKDQKMTVIIKVIDGNPIVSISSNESIIKENKEFTEEDIEPIIRKRKEKSISSFW